MPCQFLFNKSGNDGTNSDSTQRMQVSKDELYIYEYFKLASVKSLGYQMLTTNELQYASNSLWFSISSKKISLYYRILM